MRVALITGAASGIGLALSRINLQKGRTVIMVDKDHNKLNLEAIPLANQFPEHVFPITCDITQTNEVKTLVQLTYERVSRLDWIYNNAGIIGTLAPIWDLTFEQIHQVINVNVYGMIHIIRAFMPLLFKQDFRSHIINIASLYALCSGSHIAPYAMAKHAVLALSESMHFDLQRLEKPVDISVALPSFTNTALLANVSEEHLSAFYHSLNALLAHSPSSLEVAEHIIEEVERKQFYIFPDKEVKGYSEERIQSVTLQENPHINNIEKLLSSLLKRKTIKT